jgi:hypothetical protein
VLWVNRYGAVTGHSEFNAKAARSALWLMLRAAFSAFMDRTAAEVNWEKLAEISEITYSAIFELKRE